MDAARLATELTNARFGTTQFRQGYDMADCADAPRAGTAPTSAPELSAMPDGAAASRPGVLARLLAAVRGNQPLR
ncbi:hypothetical protein ACXR8F_18395 [Terrabacter sp. AAH1]